MSRGFWNFAAAACAVGLAVDTVGCALWLYGAPYDGDLGQSGIIMLLCISVRDLEAKS